MLVKLVELRRETISTVHLDFLRSLAALVVLTNHIRNLFFVDYKQVIFKNILVNFLYCFSSFGYQAVIVFFILSGFLISLTVLKNIENWSWKLYLINRLSRLYTVLIIALILCFCLDSLGISLWGKNSIYYTNLIGSNLIDRPVIDKFNINIFIGNLLFLQNILVPTFGTNDTLWTLSYEFWYYILFPCILIIFYPKSNFRTKFLYTLIVLTIFHFVGNSIAVYFFIWVLGVPICLTGNFRLKKVVHKLALMLISVFMFLSNLFLIRLDLLKTSYLSDLILAIVTAILIYSLLQDDRKEPIHYNPIQDDRKEPIHYNPIWYSYKTLSQVLASFSYTLYLVHMPILVFLNASFLKETRWQPDTFHLILGLVLFLLVLGYAFLISLFTEAKTEKVRKFFKLYLIQ